MSLLDDLAPVYPTVNASSEHQRNGVAAGVERARALAEARAQALECASRVFAGRPALGGSPAVLALADRFVEWLLRPEPDLP